MSESNNVSESNKKNLGTIDKSSVVDLNQDNPIMELSKALGEVENVFLDLQQKVRALAFHKDTLKKEREEIEKNRKLENKLKDLTNELPPNTTKFGDCYEDIKNYFNLCKLIDEKNSKLDNAYQQLLKYDKNVFPELKNYCDKWNESSSVDSYLKSFIDTAYDYKTNNNTLQQEKERLTAKIEELEKNLKLENKLKDLTNELPSNTTKFGDCYEDIKNYFNLCKLIDEKNSKLDNAYQQLLKYDKNIFPELKNYCEKWNESGSVDNYLKNFIDTAYDYKTNSTTLQQEKKRLTAKIEELENKNRGLLKEKENLEKFYDKWKETAKSIEEVKETEYDNIYKDLKDQVSKIEETIPNNQEAAILLLDIISRNTSYQYKDLNHHKSLDITIFSYYLKYLSDILNNAGLPDYSSKMKERAKSKQENVTMEYKKLENKKMEPINYTMHAAIPRNFIELCGKLRDRSNFFIENRRYDESEAMTEALQMCIDYTNKLYNNENFRNLLKSFNEEKRTL